MTSFSRNFIFMVIACLLANCRSSTKTSGDSAKRQDTSKTMQPVAIPVKQDSIDLTVLVRKLYKWHKKTNLRSEGFKPVKANQADTLYTGIDLDENQKAIEELKQTGLFADEFLDEYRAIAVRMDKELRNGSSEWREGDIPTFEDDVDEWCNCQDSPAGFPENITLANLKIKNDEAIFKWTWGDNFYYKVRAKKQGATWKVSYLEGFDMSWYDWGWVTKHKQK